MARWLYRLFNKYDPPSMQEAASRQRGVPKPAAAGDDAESKNHVTPAFITPQSLLSFTGASAAAWGSWAVVSLLADKNPQDLLIVGYVIALLISLLIWLINITDPDLPAGKPNKREAIIGLGIAFLNSGQIFMASYGAASVTAVKANGTG
ncbi:MAG: hypothetical protein RLO01_05720 [Thalassobaculaceae bacterium]